VLLLSTSGCGLLLDTSPRHDTGAVADAGPRDGGMDALVPDDARPMDAPTRDSAMTPDGPVRPDSGTRDTGIAVVDAVTGDALDAIAPLDCPVGCLPGLICCAPDCVNIDVNPNHCGGCGIRCPSFSCSAGGCFCTLDGPCPPGHVCNNTLALCQAEL
jgi:hypothetical protein